MSQPDGRLSRPRVLGVTSELPWPLDSGGHLRTFHLLRAMAQTADVRLCCPVRAGQEDAVEALTVRGIVVLPVPVPRRVAVGELQRLAAGLRDRLPYVMYGRHGWPAVTEVLREQCRDWAPDVVYLDHLDSFWHAERAVAAGVSWPPMVIDLHNIYSLLAQRTAQANRGLKRRFLEREAALLAATERRAVAGCVATLAVSDLEAGHFRRIGGRAVFTVPNGVDCAAWASLPVGRAGPPVVMFLGAMSWPPNIEAVLFLARVALPRVRESIPDARLLVVGRDAPSEVHALTGVDWIEVTGQVPDVRPYLERASALAVPLDAGGGTRLKILEAFGAGLPVVSTPVGVEGIDVVPGRHCLTAGRDEFAEAVVRVLTDRSLGASLAAAARHLALERYDWTSIGRAAARTVLDAARQPTTAPPA
jgi:glycosyltransferase involved in cell wall biosynthesis